MSAEDEFRVRPGRIRHAGGQDSRSFVGQVLRAAHKASGPSKRRQGWSSTFGRGRSASVNALGRVGGRSRSVVIKARVVRHRAGGAPLGLHVKYLQREGVDREGAPGRLFDACGEDADGAAFAGRCADDRHHFRFIVAPEDAGELSDLKAFTRDLMRQAESDLGTKLDWVAVDHWNTAHPHIHVLVRGKDQDGQDLVIARDYISEGMRARASRLVTLELGPRTDQEIRRGLTSEIEAERWTKLDRALAREASGADGVIDLRRGGKGAGEDLRRLKIARLGKLERLGLAEPQALGRWRLSPDAEPTLRELARRGDIIARIHRSLSDQGVERAMDAWRLGAEEGAAVVGRLMGRGLDDELKGSGWVVIDGIDGRAHDIALLSLEAATDAPIGAVVEARWIDGRQGKRHVLGIRSDLTIGQQINAEGATWLDRQLVGRDPPSLGESGFGAEVRAALKRRTAHLAAQGLVQTDGRRTIFVQGLIETLQRRELAGAADKLAAETDLSHRLVAEGETVSGVVRQRVTLASGRFAMIADGLGFSLVPWRVEFDRQLGRQVSGIALPGGGIDWSRGRGLGR